MNKKKMYYNKNNANKVRFSALGTQLIIFLFLVSTTIGVVKQGPA